MNVKTWEQECRNRLIIRDEGATALCVLWYLLDKIRVDEVGCNPAVLGNLRTPIGLSWFLRGLWELPHITDVVVWGPDLTRTGEALMRLWRDGLTPDHRIPGDDFGWKIDPLVDAASIEWLRGTVVLHDARSVKRATEIASIAPCGVVRERKTFPPVEVPERILLPSRGAFAPVVADDVGTAWIEALNAVIHCGDVRVSRKGEKLIHFFGVSVTFPVPPKEEIPEAFDITPADVEAYYERFLKAVRVEGTDYHYGERVFNWRGHNQVEELIARFRESLDTKRGTLAVLEAPDIEELEDAPCWTHTTFSINLSDKTLSSWTVFRSHDMYGGWPLNVLTILRLHRSIADRLADLGIKLGNFCVTSENAQVYERHSAIALAKIDRYGVTLSNVGKYVGFKTDPAGNFIFEIQPDRTVRATMTNYTGDEILWERSDASPQRLIQWIIAKHPWIKPDHARYLGVEQKKLENALAGIEPYVQG